MKSFAVEHGGNDSNKDDKPLQWHANIREFSCLILELDLKKLL